MQISRDLPRRDFVAIIISLAGITLLSWLYIVKIAADMSMPEGLSSIQVSVWDFDYFGMMFLMWAVMMVGMMLPSVTPMVMVYAGIARKSNAQGMPVAPISAFVSGYLAIWVIFSLFATIAQWGLATAALLSPMMVSSSVGLGAI